MKPWSKLALLAVLFAVPATACLSPDDDPTVDEPTTDDVSRAADPGAALEPDLDLSAIDEVADPGDDTAEACCLEGSAVCPTTLAEWGYVCASRYRQRTACNAACNVPCQYSESNSCIP